MCLHAKHAARVENSLEQMKLPQSPPFCSTTTFRDDIPVNLQPTFLCFLHGASRGQRHTTQPPPKILLRKQQKRATTWCAQSSTPSGPPHSKKKTKLVVYSQEMTPTLENRDGQTFQGWDTDTTRYAYMGTHATI